MRVAIVGLGRMGRVHFEAARMLGADIVSGFDLTAESRHSFASATSVPTFPIDELLVRLAQNPVDGVIVATTTRARFEILSSILAENPPAWLLAEKPISSSLRQLEVLQEMARASGTRLAVNHQMRFLPQYVIVRQFVDSAELGALRSMNVSGANFGLANNVSHYFEAFRFLTGGEVTEIAAYLERDLLGSHRGTGFVDYAGSVRAAGCGQTSLYVDFPSRLGHAIFATYGFEFGKIVVDELGGHVRVSRRRESDLGEPAFRYGLQSELCDVSFEPAELETATSRVIDVVANGSTLYPDDTIASHSLRCIVAAIVSSDNGSRIQGVQTADLGEHRSREFDWS